MSPGVVLGIIAVFTAGIYIFARRDKKSPAEAALAHLAQGNSIRAEMLMHGALKSAIHKHGADHPRVATLRLQLGMITTRSGHPEEALEAFREGVKVPPADEADAAARKPAIEAYGQLLANMAVRAFKARKSKQAKEYLQEAVGVIEQDSPLHGFVTAQLGAVNAGRAPDFAARERALGAALLNAIKARCEAPNLGEMQVTMGAGSFSAEPAFTEEPSPAELEAVGQALRVTFAEIEKSGVDDFLAAHGA